VERAKAGRLLVMQEEYDLRLEEMEALVRAAKPRPRPRPCVSALTRAAAAAAR
jgi:hypothetical protein